MRRRCCRRIVRYCPIYHKKSVKHSRTASRVSSVKCPHPLDHASQQGFPFFSVFFILGLYKRPHLCYNTSRSRGISAVGSAPHWQCGGQEFESPMLHQPESPCKSRVSGLLFCCFSLEKPDSCTKAAQTGLF